jgi:hypothetical protein
VVKPIVKANGSFGNNTASNIGVIIVWLFGAWPNKGRFIRNFDGRGFTGFTRLSVKSAINGHATLSLGSKDLLPSRRFWGGIPIKIVVLRRIKLDGIRRGQEANGGTKNLDLFFFGLVLTLAKVDFRRIFLHIRKVLFLLPNFAFF